jgi:hypothetical protein
MKRALLLGAALLVALSANVAHAQYAVGHHSWGAGTAFGVGYSKMDLQFQRINDGKLPEDMTLLLPTLELKFFLHDQLSIDFSVPVLNLAFSNALRDYFFVTGEAYVNFHPGAPNNTELFVAPGIGFSYAYDSWEDANGDTVKESAWAFHVPVRIGFEFNNPQRKFSWFVAVRPFINLVHGQKGDINPGGGAMLEIGIMTYGVSYRGNRW